VLSLLADQAAIAIRNARLFTEAQERASALAEALERLQQLDEMKSQFIQNTSHELRTPITLIRGHAELLEHGSLGSLKPEQQESVNLIARRSRMLSKMLKDLRVLLNTERRKTEHTPIEMVSMLRALSKEFQIRAQETELTLDASIEAETAVVLGNEVHLNRVVDNLMDNAIKFTPAGGHIDLRFWREKNWGILEVSDTGIGIPENERQRIFERFYQVDGGMTRRYGGTGLGLALVKEIVEAHGGQVTAESILGEGSTLRVTLPLVET
jgi:signal transduction histidine kinase